MLREEARAGHLDPRHLQKAEQRLKRLTKILREYEQYPLSRTERETAEAVRRDLNNAIEVARGMKK